MNVYKQDGVWTSDNAEAGKASTLWLDEAAKVAADENYTSWLTQPDLSKIWEPSEYTEERDANGALVMDDCGRRPYDSQKWQIKDAFIQEWRTFDEADEYRGKISPWDWYAKSFSIPVLRQIMPEFRPDPSESGDYVTAFNELTE